MQSAIPARKVLVGGLAGAITAILVWVLRVAHVTEVPGEISAAISTVLTFIVSYLVPPSPNDQVV